MMTNDTLPGGARVQARIWHGYGRAAARVGSPFTLYRPSGGGPVLVPANAMGLVPVVVATAGGAFDRPNLYGQALRQLLVDGSETLVGDYLSDGTRTLFVAAMEPLLPILGVACNRIVGIVRAGVGEPGRAGAADAGYRGNSAVAESAALQGRGAAALQGWPVSLLLGGAGGVNAPMKLPGDASGAGWSMLLPHPPCLAAGGFALGFGDRVTCDLGRRYSVTGAELSPLGWRVGLAELEI